MPATNGNDTIFGTAADETIDALDGDDLIVNEGGGRDVFIGGDGNDTLSTDVSDLDPDFVLEVDLAAGTHGRQDSDIGQDSISGIENFRMQGDWDAEVTGDSNDNFIETGDGDDTLFGAAGDDTLDGGEGRDRADFRGEPAGAIANLQDGTARDGYGDLDTLINIENLTGSDFGDTLIGDANDNDLIGKGGNDLIRGGGGRDVIKGDAGNDTLDGGAGDNDILGYRFEGGPNGGNADLAAGTAIDTYGDSDLIMGFESIHGSDMDDVLKGDDADNELEGRRGNDTLVGRGGSDTLRGEEGDDSLDGGDGDDSLSGHGGSDTLIGGRGRDFLWAGDGDDLLRGGDGDDFLLGQAGNDTIDGEAGFDRLDMRDAPGPVDADLTTGIVSDGYGGTDIVTSVERLLGSEFDDRLVGPEVSDFEWSSFSGGGGNDTIIGNTRYSIVWYGSAPAAVSVDLETGIATGAEGNDTLVRITDLAGSNFSDLLLGDAGDNYFVPDVTADSYSPNTENGGTDTIDGRGGRDIVNFEQEAGAVDVDLAAGTAIDSRGNIDTLISIEIVEGSRFDDVISGSSGDDELQGRDGDDTVAGGAGDDTIEGWLGADSLTGGDGADMFSGTLEELDGDIITDFEGIDEVGVLDDRFNLVGALLSIVGSELRIDIDGDGTAEAAMTLENGYSGSVTSAGGAPFQVIGSDDDDEIVTQGEDDTVDAGDGDDVIDTGEGDDIVSPGAGNDMIRLGDGADTIRDTLENLLGDSVADFTLEDRLVFLGTDLDRSDISVSRGSAILSIDGDDDGSADGEITLEGDFSGGDFMLATLGEDQQVTFERFLPDLSEGLSVSSGDINGVSNQPFLTGDGETGFRVTLLEADAGARYDNALGVYEVDADGGVVDVRLLAAKVKSGGTFDITNVEGGNRLGFFIVQDGADWAASLVEADTLSFVDSTGESPPSSGTEGTLALAVNGMTSGVTVLHSFDAGLNPDGETHVLSGVDAGGEALLMGFEDLIGIGDSDFQDVVFSVEQFDIA